MAEEESVAIGDGGLVAAETQETGRVNSTIIANFLRGFGQCLLLCVALTSLPYPVLLVLTQFFLDSWSEAGGYRTTYYATVYGALCSATAVVYLLQWVAFSIGLS